MDDFLGFIVYDSELPIAYFGLLYNAISIFACIDKKSEIGSPKRCAEGVSIEGLEKLGIEPSPRWITSKIEGVRIQTPDGTDIWLTEDEVKLPEAGYILERKVFDKHMAMDAARAGAEIRIKTLVTGVEKIPL